jgi:hypothetical protein
VVDAGDVTVGSGSVRVVALPGVPDAPVELRVKVSGRVRTAVTEPPEAQAVSLAAASA